MTNTTNTTADMNDLTNTLSELEQQADSLVASLESERDALIERHKAERAELDSRLSAARAQARRLKAIASPPKPSERKVNPEWRPGVGTHAYQLLVQAKREGKVVSNAKTQQAVSKLTTCGYLDKVGHRQGFTLSEKGEEFLAEHGE